MTRSFLQLNDSKTEFVIFSSKRSNIPADLSSVRIGSVYVSSQYSARNLGVIFDSSLNMKSHISNICKTSYSYIRSIRKIRKFLSRSDAEKLVHAFISSRLDCCKSLLAELPSKDTIKTLQLVQNAAARVVTRARRYDHITPILKGLHWLPIRD